MKTLKDELRVKPEESAVEYAERIEGVLERHELETGEKVNSRLLVEGEDTSDLLERVKMEERRQTAQEAAKRSRQLVREVRRQQGRLDGTADRARERQARLRAPRFRTPPAGKQQYSNRSCRACFPLTGSYWGVCLRSAWRGNNH